MTDVLGVRCTTCGASDPKENEYCSNGFHALGKTYWPTDPIGTAQERELIEKLLLTKTEVRINPIFGGALAYSDGETREVPINPDGPAAADALQSRIAEVGRLEQRVRELEAREELSDRCAKIEADAVSGLHYIERRYGRLEGVGWDRVFDAHDALFARAALSLHRRST